MTAQQRAVVALGGNAFVGRGGALTMDGQLRFAEEAMSALLPIFDRYRVVVTHGNGPQVGHMLIRVERALGEAYALPLEVCVAETEGELGYVLAQSLHNVLAEHGAPRPVASLLCQVLVERDDPAFDFPTKPIGPVLSDEEAERLRAAGMTLVHEPGRGHRRVVASPVPVDVIDLSLVDALLDRDAIVITAGGGGVPVVRDGERLRGIEAVVDKDRASALLAERLGAELLLILTDVPCAYRSFRGDAPEPIGEITPEALRSALAAGEFAPGSMGPKVEAAIAFAEEAGRRAIICDPASIVAALAGDAGTIVTKTGEAG